MLYFYPISTLFHISHLEFNIYSGTQNLSTLVVLFKFYIHTEQGILNMFASVIMFVYLIVNYLHR